MKEALVTKTIIYGALILGAFVPVVPTEVQHANWDSMQQIEAYNTDDGLLSDTQYFEEGDGTFKVKDSVTGFPMTVNELGKEHTEKVTRAEGKSIYINSYKKILDENIYVVITDDDPKYEYEKVKRSEIDEPNIKERQSIIDLLVDPLPVEAFTPDRYSSNTFSAATQTVTFSHTISAGDVLIMVVGITDATPAVVQSATYNSVSMTMETSFATSTDSMYVFYLSNPTTGTNNIFVDLDAGTGSADRGYIKAISLSGADTSDPIELTQTAYGTGTTTQTITHTAGNIGIDIINSRDTSIVNNINTLEGSSLTYYDSGSFTYYSNEYINKYVPTKTKSISAQEGTPTGLTWRTDGTRVYVVGTVNDTAFQYSCSTSWDPSSCTYDSVSLAMSTEDSAPQDIAWGNSGAKFYMVGSGNDRIYQYSCSTVYTLSSCTYDSISTSTPLGEPSPETITWHPDGDRFWIAGTSLDQAREYTLTTPWDISTAATTTKTLSLGNNPSDFEFSSDGYFAFSIAPATDVRQFYCTTAYDVSTCTQIKEIIPRSFAQIEPNTGESMYIKDLTTVFAIGTQNDTIYTYEENTSTTTTTMGVNNGAGKEMWSTIGVIIRKATAPATGGVIDSGIIWYNEE